MATERMKPTPVQWCSTEQKARLILVHLAGGFHDESGSKWGVSILSFILSFDFFSEKS